jgi:diadenosine tetraphosphate (Ap4A) HIT family hydrolase
MITKKRIVLLANGVEVTDLRYEAIEIIADIGEIERVWKNNKTPLFLKEQMKKNDFKKLDEYEVVEVPEFIFGAENFISFCHSNGFECGEPIKDKKFDTSKERCFLCGIANHMNIKGPLYMYNQRTKRESDCIIYESANFFVKIELGCLTPGMVMINPKMHVLSAAQIPDEQFEEYLQVMKDTEFLLKEIYGRDEPVMFFEHGSAPSGISSHERSIVHAHTHVAIGVRFDQKYIDMVSLKPVEDIRAFDKVKYLSYQEGTTGQLYVCADPEVYVQRQYPRQVIGEILGIDNDKTNWRKEPFELNITKTHRDFYQFLSEYQQFLNSRIVKATEGFVKGYLLRTAFGES